MEVTLRCVGSMGGLGGSSPEAVGVPLEAVLRAEGIEGMEGTPGCFGGCRLASCVQAHSVCS